MPRVRLTDCAAGLSSVVRPAGPQRHTSRRRNRSSRAAREKAAGKNKSVPPVVSCRRPLLAPKPPETRVDSVATTNTRPQTHTIVSALGAVQIHSQHWLLYSLPGSRAENFAEREPIENETARRSSAAQHFGATSGVCVCLSEMGLCGAGG
jgi:hypothetical protein